MTFGQRLKQLREKAGLTQEALARAANLALSTIAKIETKAIDPEWSTAQRLARALGVSCSEFEMTGLQAEEIENPEVKRKGK